MTYHPSRAYVLTVVIAAEVFLIGAFRLLDASVAHDQAQLEWEKFLASEQLSGKYPSSPVGSVSTVMPLPSGLQWAKDPGPTWHGDLTGSGPPVAYYGSGEPPTSESPLATMGGQPCSEVALYEDGKVVSAYPGGCSKPCVRGCLAVGSDHLPRMGDPKDRHAWISRMQLCIMAECKP
jgi:hypothetical protein